MFRLGSRPDKDLAVKIATIDELKRAKRWLAVISHSINENTVTLPILLGKITLYKGLEILINVFSALVTKYYRRVLYPGDIFPFP